MANAPDISLPGTNAASRHGTEPAKRPPQPEPAVLAPLAVLPPVRVVPVQPGPPAAPTQPDPPAVLTMPDPPAVLTMPEPPVVVEPELPAAAAHPEPEVQAAPAHPEPVVVVEPEPAPPRGRDLTATQIRRLVVLAVTIVLLGTGAGLLGTLVWSPTYAARAEILYPLDQDEPSALGERKLTTQLVLLQGRSVLGPVAGQQARAVEDLERDVAVTVLEASEVIQVEARGASRAAAMATVQAILDRYFALAGTALTGDVRDYLDGQLAAVQSDIADARGRLVQLQAEQAAGIGDGTAVAGADDELQTLLSREQDIRAQLDELSVAEGHGTAPRLLTPAYHVPDPVSPRPLPAAGTGALIGLVVAAAAVALAARRWIRHCATS